MATETVIQQVGESPEIEAYRIGLLKSAKELADKGITLPQSKIADFTGLQNASFNRVSDYYGQDGTGIAGYQPYMDQATANFTGAGTNLAASQDLTGTRVGNVLNTGIAGAVNPAIAQSLMSGNYAMGAANEGMAGSRSSGNYGIGAANEGMMGSRSSGNYGMDAANQGMSASMLGGNYGMGAATQGIAGLSGLSNQYDPNSYQQYMDPYMNDVIQQQYQDIQRQGDIQQQSANAQAVGAGAFGGSRQGIQQAEINRNVLDQQARTGSQLRSAGYQNAQQQAQAAFENSRARQAQQAQLTGQLGQIGSQAGLQYGQQIGQLGQMGSQAGLQSAQQIGQLGQMGSQAGLQSAQQIGQLGQMGSQAGLQAAQQMGQLGLSGQELYGNLAMNYGQQGLQGSQIMGDLGTRQAALGELGQNMLTKDAELMYTLGGRQQAQQQAGLEATRSNQMAQLYEPYQRLGYLSDIYSKTPTTQQTISQSTSPSVSPFQQYLGLGIAGLSAGAGAAKAGLFG